MNPSTHQRLAMLLASALLAAFAPAQSRFTQVVLDGENFVSGDSRVNSIAFVDSDSGTPISIAPSRAFTGLDGAGTIRTMTVSGTSFASSQYGRMRSSMSLRAQNTYANPSNAPYYDGTTVNEAGSPDRVSMLSFAGFTDTLQFGGELQSGYTVRYVFAMTGTRPTSPDQRATALIYGNIGDNPRFVLSPVGQGSTVSELVATESYPIDGSFRQTADFTLTTQTGFTFSESPDGSDLFRAADFASTAVLEEVQVFDADGNRATNVTAVGSSGTVYNTQPVPEPATLAALGFGALALVRRRGGRGRRIG